MVPIGGANFYDFGVISQRPLDPLWRSIYNLIPVAITLFDDERFTDLLVSLLCKDRVFLAQAGHLLTPQDFKPRGNGQEHGRERWILSQLALEHFEKYREPIGNHLTSEVISYAKTQRMGAKQQEQLSDFAEETLEQKVTAVERLTEKVLQYKRERIKATCVQELIQLQSEGQLTNERWWELCQKGMDTLSVDIFKTKDYLEDLDARIERRKNSRDVRFPLLLIDPLDVQVRGIARGHLGLIMAPWKRGKSLALIWLAMAYALQRLNVLYITLEDPLEDVEDRFDAAATQLPLKKLATMPRRVRQRFRLFKRMMRTKIHIHDGCEQQMTVPMIEALYEKKRNEGFTADAIFVDYDDEIKATKKQEERRMEFSDIYRQMRQLAARKQAILWTAAQTRRQTEHLKVLSGDTLAEDISKIRKVSMAIAIGQGDWGEDSLYYWVAAHKFDRQHVGCNVMADKERMLIYDREGTLRAMKEHAREEEEPIDV